jgi:hypothetical protein
MKYSVFVLTLSCLVMAERSWAASPSKTNEVLEMQEQLKTKGWDGFTILAKRQNLPTPQIPSRWHVEHVSTGEVQRVEIASRELGKQLVDQLSDLPTKLNGPLTQKELHEHTIRLLDLSEWCASTEGYGNLLLAQRGLDLACIPLMRLVADLTFPADRYAPLMKRLQPQWMSAEVRRRVLNQEAGAELFPINAKQEEELGLVWGSGVILRLERGDPSLRERRKTDPMFANVQVQERPEIVANLDFFADDQFSRFSHTTLKGRWDAKFHEGIVVGLDLRLENQVRALAEFRAVVGSFPTEDNPHSPFRGGKGAFMEAWRPTVKKLPGMTDEQWNNRLNQFVTAWQAYESVQRGEILDTDSWVEKIQKLKQGKRRP